MKVVFDIGATKTRLAAVAGHKLTEITVFETDTSGAGPKTMVERLREFVHGRPVEAIVGDMSGVILADGRLTRVPNLPHWEYQNIVEIFTTDFFPRPQLFNDVVLCGVGEARYGAGRPAGSMAYITVSTGVNAVRIIDGYASADCLRPDFGQMLVSGGVTQAAGIESLVGGAAVQRRTGHAPQQIKDSAFWKQEAAYLARMIFNIRLFWDPELVVLGGSMMNDIQISDIEQALRDLPAAFEHPIVLKHAQLRELAGLYGAMTYLENSV
ncbi:MAG TPA: ROK family protein [Candidatus Saccharimonadia bacterium]